MRLLHILFVLLIAILIYALIAAISQAQDIVHYPKASEVSIEEINGKPFVTYRHSNNTIHQLRLDSITLVVFDEKEGDATFYVGSKEVFTTIDVNEFESVLDKYEQSKK